jgi:repressor LexA
MYTMNNTLSLTARQQAILNFIRERVAAQGLPPSLAEIAEAFGFAHRSAAQKHLQALEAKGVLSLLPGKARGIQLTDTAFARERGEQLEVPILGRVAAGTPIGADAGVERMVLIDRALFSPKPDYLLRVHGDSMRDDGIFDGDLVAVHRTSEARNGQVVIARVDGEITIKRLERGRRGIRLLPRNPDYPPITVEPGQDFAIEGLYCGLVRAN